MPAKPFFAALASLALAGCNSGTKPDAAATAAGGDVVEGTISDAMVNLDQSTATAPLMPAKPEKGEGKNEGKDKPASAEATPRAAATAAAPEPDTPDRAVVPADE